MMLFTNEMKEEMRMRGCKDCTYFIPGVNACVRGFKRCAVTEPRKTIKKGRYWYDLPLSCRYCYFWDPKTRSCIRGGGSSCAYLVSEDLYIPKPDDLPKRKKSVCETCPYGRREPCIGVCMKKLLKEWREERKEATVYASNMKKRIAMLALAATILTGCTAMPAFAYTEQNANPGETIVIGQDVPDASESEENTESNKSAQAESQDAASKNTEASNEESAEEPVIDRSDAEPVDPLTPNGNMTLVDDVTVSTGTKQFLTLTTRNGNFYYLIIDRDKDGNENVHFLNQVDERDLISLMDEDEAKELEEQLAKQKAEEEAAQAALAGPTEEPEPTPEPEPEPEKVINIGGFEFSQKIFTALIGCGLIIIIAVVMLVKFGKKKKPEENKPDPDADYEEDLGDEMEFEQGEFEDEDYDE